MDVLDARTVIGNVVNDVRKLFARTCGCYNYIINISIIQKRSQLNMSSYRYPTNRQSTLRPILVPSNALSLPVEVTIHIEDVLDQDKFSKTKKFFS